MAKKTRARFSKEELTELMKYGEKKAKQAGMTSEDQINEMFYEQRHETS